VNPEIPTVQIAGVSWEYLKLKKKNLKQEKIDYQLDVEGNFGYINSFRVPSDNHFIEIEKKIKNYKETQLLKKWKKELETIPTDTDTNIGYDKQLIINYYKIVNTPAYHWDTFSPHEKTGRFIQRQLKM
jgi:hypothetical protein